MAPDCFVTVRVWLERVIRTKYKLHILARQVENLFRAEAYLVHTVSARASKTEESSISLQYPAKRPAERIRCTNPFTLLSFLLTHVFLLAIAILCFFALLLAATAIARHVRTPRISARPQPDFAHHLFVAANGQRTLPQQNMKDVIAKTRFIRALESTLAETRHQPISSKRF
jgi:hypothetical protein